MKNILCFGDSNTYGHNPANKERYDYDVRWTGVLQNILGKDYRIIEEGLGGRTTLFDDNIVPYRNSRNYIEPCIHSHRPLDLIVVCLGTNDLKSRFNTGASDIARAMSEIVKIIKAHDYEPYTSIPKILIMSPIRIGVGIDKLPNPSFNADAVQKSEELARYYKKLADDTKCYFFDAGSVAKPSEKDHLHIDPEGHSAIAEALSKEIKKILA